MKVLFACIPTPNNRFMADLKAGIEKYAEVVWDCDEFWNCNNHYDIVHIHWPEYLSFEIESYLPKTSPLPPLLWKRITDCFEYWKKNSSIIYTRHVQGPHTRDDAEFRELYRLTMTYCSAVAHFGKFSIEQFKAFYPEINLSNHKVIPHHNYASLPNNATKQEARKKLRINKSSRVMLVFGAVKENEKELILEAFKAIPGNNKVVLSPGWKITRKSIKWIRMREWVFQYQKWIASQNKKHRKDLGFIDDNDAQYYCNASDFLFIPRTNELNSGNITFGCTFGLVVVGKDTADIGEILNETGNPVFRVGDSQSLKKAILSAIALADNNKGNENKSLALSEWSIDKIALQYINLYKSSL
jgi:hypothetical protein